MRRVLFLAVLCALGAPTWASAELVTLTTGRVLSVRSYHEDGAVAILVLRDGGEVQCPPDLVVRVDPDEVPYPEPGGEVDEADLVPADAPYRDLIDRLARAHGVDARLVHAIVRVESAYRAHARSPKGAMGLMQLMPGTASQYGVSDPYDPASNLDAGIRHLKGLLDRLDLPLAVAAYNAGEGAVRRFGGIPPFAETRAYVRLVLAASGLATD